MRLPRGGLIVPASAEAVAIARALGEPVSSEALGSGPRTEVARVRLVDRSVIVKRWHSQPERGESETEALRSLPDGIAPRLLHAQPAAIVMEDLGDGSTLEDFLQLRGKPADVSAIWGRAKSEPIHAPRLALLEVAAALGRAHERLRSLTPGSDFAVFRFPEGEHPVVGRAIRESAGALATWGLDIDAAEIAARFDTPGESATLTNGDLAPSSAMLAGGAWRILDWEYAAVRSALYDTLFWALYCPFPPALIAEADAAWRAEFPLDDATFRAQRSATLAGRLVCQLRWSLPVLEADREFAPGITERAALLWQLTRGAAECAPELASRFAKLADRLARAWALDPLAAPAAWPAFR